MDNQIYNDPDIKISVIMPIYNAGEYLCRAMGDVLAQTLSDFEIICIDDGSTDNSPRIIKRYQEKDARIRTLRESNAGPSAARNKGIEMARGKYMIFLDADDFFEKDLLMKLYETAESDNLDIAVTKFDIYNESKDSFSLPVDEPHGNIFVPGGVTSKNEHPDFILSSTTGYVWNKLFRTSFIRDKKLIFDPELYVFEDVAFVCSAMSLAERVGRIDGTLVHHRVYSDQSRARLFRKYYGQVPVVYKKVKEFLMQRGMYVPLKKSFLNLSAGRCYKIYNLLWADGKESLWTLLHDEYAAELNWLGHEKTEFESPEVCEFVANVALYTHAEYRERVEKGKNINIGELEKDEIVKKVKVKQKGARRRAVWSKIIGFLNIFKRSNKKAVK
nr:glycosyltransferase [Oscillospiraceae bacterium]